MSPMDIFKEFFGTDSYSDAFDGFGGEFSEMFVDI